MKKQSATAVAATSSNRTSLKQPKAAQEGKLVIVRPSALDKDGITGIVASGVLEKVEPNKFNAAKSDYFIRNADGTLYILNETQSIKEQLGQEGTIGLNIEVEYSGKVKTKNGKGYHSFECFIVA